MLAPHAQQMGAHEAMIVAVAKRAREATIEDVQAKLHEADTIDHEMIDEAIEYATLRREEGEG